MDSYYRKKALYAKQLYDKNLPFVKVYAAVKIGENYLVLKKQKEGKVSYHLAGGGVEKNESLVKAVKRELLEELNAEVKIIRKLGVYDKLTVPYELDGERFFVKYEIHVFLTEFVKSKNKKFGLKGEFDSSIEIAQIDEKTLLENVAEFCDFNIALN